MNSKLSPAPNQEQSPASYTKKTSLSRHSWTRLLAIRGSDFDSMASAYAAPGVQVGNQQMFRPRGMVRATVPNPVAGGAPLHDYWVADGASGFCRLDNVGPDTAPRTAS